MNIELTEKQKHYLKLFAKKQYQGAKDNLSTYQPIHVVQTQRSIVVDADYDYDEIVYVVTDRDYEEYKQNELFRLIEDFYEYDELPFELVSYEKAYGTEIGKKGEEIYISDEEDYLQAYGIKSNYYNRCAVKYYYEDIAYFWTLQSAKEYIKYQSHNLNNPRTYTKGGGYDNRGEYHHFWELLMSIGKQLNDDLEV